MTDIRALLFPDPPRGLRHARAWNIAVRTAHIVVMGLLLGGHAFGASAADLTPVLWLVVSSGVALAAIEAYPSFDWVHEARGVMVLGKTALICLVPFAWGARVPILVIVVVIASVGAHMPARYRYYSLLYRSNMKSGRAPAGTDHATRVR